MVRKKTRPWARRRIFNGKRYGLFFVAKTKKSAQAHAEVARHQWGYARIVKSRRLRLAPKNFQSDRYGRVNRRYAVYFRGHKKQLSWTKKKRRKR